MLLSPDFSIFSYNPKFFGTKLAKLIRTTKFSKMFPIWGKNQNIYIFYSVNKKLVSSEILAAFALFVFHHFFIQPRMQPKLVHIVEFRETVPQFESLSKLVYLVLESRPIFFYQIVPNCNFKINFEWRVSNLATGNTKCGQKQYVFRSPLGFFNWPKLGF